MDWKRIGRAAMCFLVICCLLFGLSPIKAEAVALELAAGTAVAVAGGLVVAAVLIGLGVQTGAMTTAWDSMVNDCHQHLISEGLADLDGTIKIMAVKGLAYSFAVSQEIVEAVRSWLFSSEVLIQNAVVSSSSVVASTAISCTSMSMSNTFSSLVRSSPENTLAMVESLGLYENVFVYSFDESYLYGCFFDPTGVFCSAAFANPLESANASLFGTYSITDLQLDFSVEIQNIHSFYKSYTDSYTYEYPVFYNSFWLEQHDDFLIMEAACFEWATLPSIHTASVAHYPQFSLYTKSSTDTVVSSIPVARGFSNYLEGDYSLGAFNWDSVIFEEVTSSFDVTLGTVAAQQVDTEIGYDTWYGNAVDIITSTSDSDDGAEPERKPFWPLTLPSSFTDAYQLKQEDIWEGNISTVDPDLDPDVQTGTLGNTPVGTFLNKLLNPIKTALQDLGNFILNGIRDIFVPSSDYLSAKVDAITAEFAFADSIAKTANGLIDGLRGVSTEPPVIYIDLSANTGPYDLGGEVPFLDLRWYAAYKPTVDTIISAFLWACFIWRMFLKLPGIINGAAGSFSLVRSHEQEDL